MWKIYFVSFNSSSMTLVFGDNLKETELLYNFVMLSVPNIFTVSYIKCFHIHYL